MILLVNIFWNGINREQTMHLFLWDFGSKLLEEVLS